MDYIYPKFKLRKVLLFFVFFLAVQAFILALFVSFLPLSVIDLKVSSFLQQRGDYFFPLIMHYISLIGNYYPAVFSVFLISIIYFIIGFKRESFFVLTVFLADLLNFVIKLIINRPRPTSELVTVLYKLEDPSFPSGHVVHFTVLFGFIFVTMFKLKKINKYLRLIISVLCLSLISLISVSRIYLGAHWFTDVIGGYLVGFNMLFVIIYYYFNSSLNTIKRNKNKTKRLTER